MRLGDGGTEVGVFEYIRGIGFYQFFFSEPVLAQSGLKLSQYKAKN